MFSESEWHTEAVRSVWSSGRQVPEKKDGWPVLLPASIKNLPDVTYGSSHRQLRRVFNNFEAQVLNSGLLFGGDFGLNGCNLLVVHLAFPCKVLAV